MSDGQRSYVVEVLKAKIPRLDRDVVVALENEHRWFKLKLFIIRSVDTTLHNV